MKEAVRQILADHDFRANSFFLDLESGEMSFEEFLRTQEQFYHAVVHFASPLALVAAALPDYESRVKIIRNLWEEHGEGNMSLTHGATFTELLRRLTGKSVVTIPAAGSEVLRFNTTLDSVCKNESYFKSVAAIGMIEYMFADISSFIGSAIINRGWLPQERIIHYALHEELDCVHAEDFFSILRPHYETNKAQIDEGLRLGATTFLELYSGLRSAR